MKKVIPALAKLLKALLPNPETCLQGAMLSKAALPRAVPAAWADVVTAAVVVVGLVVRVAAAVVDLVVVVEAVVAAEAEAMAVVEAVAVTAAAVVVDTVAECPAKAIHKAEDIRFFTCSAVFC